MDWLFRNRGRAPKSKGLLYRQRFFRMPHGAQREQRSKRVHADRQAEGHRQVRHATVKLKGWFKPPMAAQINQRDDGYYIGSGDKQPKLNGNPITEPVRLNDGDTIEVGGVRLNFDFRE